MYCKALVEICALKVNLHFVSISGAEEPVSLSGWELGGAEEPAEVVPIPIPGILLVLWTFQNHNSLPGCSRLASRARG